MSRPMTAAQWKSQLKKWGVNTTYLKGWETRGRNFGPGGSSRPFSNVNGIMIHHTGSDEQTKRYINWLFLEGRPAEGIPAPLAQTMTMMDGTVVMGAVGRANHAGRGVQRVLTKVIAETVSLTEEEKPGALGTVDGNARFYGNEVAYDGGQSMKNPQYRSVVLWCCAIADFHDWTGQSVIGHGEWTSAKWDPGKCDMAKLRRDVNAQLKAGPPGSSAPPKPVPPKKEYKPLVGIRTLNTWGNSTEGAKNFKSRAPQMAKDLAAGNRTVLLIQELRDDQEPILSRELEKRGYRLVRHASLLAIYVYKTVTIKAHKVEMLDTQNKGWEERVLMAHLVVKGQDVLVANTHLDYRDGFDQGRVDQAKQAIKALDVYGEQRGVPKAFRVLAGDMNSEGWVTDKAAEPAGYRDAFELIGKAPKTKRIDWVFFAEGSRVENAWQSTTKSDHKIHTAVLMKAA